MSARRKERKERRTGGWGNKAINEGNREEKGNTKILTVSKKKKRKEQRKTNKDRNRENQIHRGGVTEGVKGRGDVQV